MFFPDWCVVVRRRSPWRLVDQGFESFDTLERFLQCFSKQRDELGLIDALVDVASTGSTPSFGASDCGVSSFSLSSSRR